MSWRSTAPLPVDASAARGLDGEAGATDTTSAAENILALGWENPDRPTDALIVDQENAIKAAVEDLPLLGEREPLSALAREYEHGSKAFAEKIEELRAKGYTGLRRTRGDGNCFYRALLFGYVEGLIRAPDVGEVRRLRSRLASRCVPALQAAGVQDLVYEDALELLTELLAGLDSPPGSMPPTPPLTESALADKVREPILSLHLLYLMRIVASAEMQSRAALFEPFVGGETGLSVPDYCHKCVEPMGEEADHAAIVALTDSLGVPIRVAYLTSSPGPVTLTDVAPEGGDPGAPPRVHLLYRPGHYDLLCTE